MMTKKKIWAILAMVLTLCAALALFALVGCNKNNEDDKNEPTPDPTTYGYTSMTGDLSFGVVPIVGCSLSTGNLKMTLIGTDSTGASVSTMITGVMAGDNADTCVFVVGNEEVDEITITDTSMSLTVRYTGSKYDLPSDQKEVTFDITAYYAVSAELIPGTLDMSNNVTQYAAYGDGADMFTLLVTYDKGNSTTGTDSHTSFTSTITNNNETVEALAAGENTISTTWGGVDENGDPIAVADVTMTFTADSYGNYTCTDYDGWTGVIGSFSSMTASTMFGVSFFAGSSVSTGNFTVTAYTDANDTTGTIINGMRASAADADNFVLCNSDGTTEYGDSQTITISDLDSDGNMVVYLKYVGIKYTMEQTIVSCTITPNVATSAKIVPYTVGFGDAISGYAQIGATADSFTVIVYYDGGNDAKTDYTITIKDSSNSEVTTISEAGTYTISATSTCLTSDGQTVSVTDITFTVTAGENSSYSYEAKQGDTTIISYTVDAEGNVTDTTPSSTTE